MAFKPPRKQPRFADLQGILAQSRDTDSALYQTMQVLIERLTQFQAVTLEQLADINNSVNDIESLVVNIADKNRTYLTHTDESLKLPYSRQLIAGDGIEFDDTVANERTIHSLASKYYDAPLTDGNVEDTGFIFGLGECIIVQVPNA